MVGCKSWPTLNEQFPWLGLLRIRMNSNDFLSEDFIDDLMPSEIVNGIQEVLDQDQQFLINEILTGKADSI